MEWDEWVLRSEAALRETHPPVRNPHKHLPPVTLHSSCQLEPKAQQASALPTQCSRLVERFTLHRPPTLRSRLLLKHRPVAGSATTCKDGVRGTGSRVRRG